MQKILFLTIAAVAGLFGIFTTMKPASITYPPFDTYQKEWAKVDRLEHAGLPQSALDEVLKIYSRAKKEDNSPQIIKAVIYRLKYKMEVNENGLQESIAELEKAHVNSKEQEIETTILIKEVERVESSVDALAEERARYSANPLNTVPFETYWKEKTEMANAARNTIYISNRFVCGDSIAFMNDVENAGRFDHVITDIPYGIDMDMLDQQNPHGGMQNLDTVIEEHDVADNMQLIRDFFPAAFRCTKDSAFVITWGDMMQWQFMYDEAIKAGFAVQRWPIVWLKTHACMNQCVNFNTTKNTEIAIVCRKPKTTIALQPNTSVIAASNLEMRKALGHPFAKPFEAWEFLIKLASLEGQLILEPFAGRGSGTLSMLRMKRHVISVEKQVTHFNSLVENMKTQYYLKINPNFVFK